jgi:hypothetical protein
MSLTLDGDGEIGSDSERAQDEAESVRLARPMYGGGGPDFRLPPPSRYIDALMVDSTCTVCLP